MGAESVCNSHLYQWALIEFFYEQKLMNGKREEPERLWKETQLEWRTKSKQ